MEYVELLVLGIVQGLTEFLPISSDGHLAVAGALFAHAANKELPADQLGVTIILHMGTLLAILVVFRQRIWRLFNEDRRLIGPLIVGTIPAGLIGVGLKSMPAAEKWLVDPLLAGLMLPITGLLLLWSARREPGEQNYETITYRQALIIGICQATAILPGISRSGTTIAAALGLGLNRESAANFSFLLAIPAVAGAGLLEGLKLMRQGGTTDDFGPLLFGTVVSFITGIIALVWLFRWLRSGRLHYFAYWCIPLGIAVVIWQLTLK